jgi:hypothetical protein
MIEPGHDDGLGSIRRIGIQPVALAAAALTMILAGVAGIGVWRAYGGMPPELDRAVAVRQLQAHAAQLSEQLVEKTKGLELTQQQSIDQLQLVQDQLQHVRKQLAAKEADTKRLSEQLASLTEAVDGLRQSFATAQPADTSGPPSRHRSSRSRAHAHASPKEAKSGD